MYRAAIGRRRSVSGIVTANFIRSPGMNGMNVSFSAAWNVCGFPFPAMTCMNHGIPGTYTIAYATNAAAAIFMTASRPFRSFSVGTPSAIPAASEPSR